MSMLVLSRKPTQVIGDKVKVGVDAPESVIVDRAEVHAKRVAKEGGK